VILIVIMIANATSMVSDFASAHIPVSRGHIWLFEASSIIAWLTAIPAIWWLVVWLRHAALPWWVVTVIVLAASLPASAWHIGVMVVLRTAVYALQGEHYHFAVGGANPLLYEYRKDAGTYLQFAAIALVAQWLIARAASQEAEPPRTIAVSDGAVTHRVPVVEIERVAAAEAELGDTFVRIHRGQIVRRDAVRRIETDKSGDFTVELASGARIRGSRRYRDRL
jgi:hypothetical protein